MKKRTESQDFLSQKRTQHTYTKREQKNVRKSGDEVDALYQSSSITAMARGVQHNWGKLKSKYVVKIPRDFSILTNPEGVLSAVSTLASRLRAGKLKEIFFDHSNVTHIDLAAESLLDCVALEYQSESRSRLRRVKHRGYFPKSQNIKAYIKAVGIIKNLDIQHELLPKGEEEKRKILKLRHRLGRTNYNASSDFKDKVILDVIDHFNDCLSEEGYALTDVGAHRLGLYVGEVLENVSEHSGRDDWYVCGYMDTTAEESNYELVIFNFGDTISQTLEALPPSSVAALEITPFVERHSHRSFFSKEWRKEDLLTLVALQGHVSSKRTVSDPDRGQGTVHLIEFFQRVRSEYTNGEQNDTRMALLSGSTYILFDGTYELVEDSRGRKIIAFNNQNSLYEKPDDSYVRRLKGVYFPGTILCIRFPMSASQIEKVSP